MRSINFTECRNKAATRDNPILSLSMRRMRSILFLALLFLATFCQSQKAPQNFDVLIRHGDIYDGSGKPSFPGDVGINADTLAAIGDLAGSRGKKEIDATGLAVAPGFINMLSKADGSLLQDGRSLSDLRQGVTLEVFGEGISPGPKKENTSKEPWKTLGQYFDYLEKKGVSTNFASFVGATTVRQHVLGQQNKKPSGGEMAEMETLVSQAMTEGAMGIGSALIYAPADYASTDELIALSKIAAASGGIYITHMRSENDNIYQALDETFRIAREANIPAEIFHLKVTQKWNWHKADTVIAKIDSARKAGLKITADMYPYNASGTSLQARLPTWVQEGGAVAMRRRLTNLVTRKRVLRELELGIPTRNSEPQDVLILGFRKDSLNRLYRNKRLDEIARLHGKNGDETMIDLLVADQSSIPSVIYFVISETNMKKMLQLPYVSIGSDGASVAAEKPFINGETHPRVYGTFARFLGKYVRDEKLMSLEEGIRRLTSLPATNLKISRRGLLAVGNYADVVIFDPARIADHATFEDSHQYATGVEHVLVNGVQVLADGQHTHAFPGRSIRGPGWRKNAP